MLFSLCWHVDIQCLQRFLRHVTPVSLLIATALEECKNLLVYIKASSLYISFCHPLILLSNVFHLSFELIFLINNLVFCRPFLRKLWPLSKMMDHFLRFSVTQYVFLARKWQIFFRKSLFIFSYFAIN